MNIDGLEVNYKTAGKGQPILNSEGIKVLPKGTVLILHGWGGTSDSWTKVQPLLAKKGYLVVVPDLPGFGKTPSPPVGWSLERYVDFIERFSEELGLKRYVLLGHSFGGRIAIRYAQKYGEEVERLILCSAAGIRHVRLRHKVFLIIAKGANIIGALPVLRRFRKPVRRLFYRAIKRTDYLEAEGVMKEVFLSALSRNLKPILSSIRTPTLIIWGEEDESVPLEDAYTMEKEIPGARLVTFPGIGHSPHKKIPEKLVEEIHKFVSL